MCVFVCLCASLSWYYARQKTQFSLRQQWCLTLYSTDKREMKERKRGMKERKEREMSREKRDNSPGREVVDLFIT